MLGPDFVIGLGRLLRSRRQDDPMQDRLPGDRRDFDDPTVGQEFGKILSDGLRIWLVRRAEVDEEDADSVHQAAIGSKGRLRKRLPDPAWIALATAGATGSVP